MGAHYRGSHRCACAAWCRATTRALGRKQHQPGAPGGSCFPSFANAPQPLCVLVASCKVNLSATQVHLPSFVLTCPGSPVVGSLLAHAPDLQMMYQACHQAWGFLCRSLQPCRMCSCAQHSAAAHARVLALPPVQCRMRAQGRLGLAVNSTLWPAAAMTAGTAALLHMQHLTWSAKQQRGRIVEAASQSNVSASWGTCWSRSSGLPQWTGWLKRSSREL